MRIYFLDDQESQRKMLEWDLKSLFGDDFEIVGLALQQDRTAYHQYLDDPETAGILIDQCLNETGEVNGFTGLDLAQHLRSLYPGMPIYLVTGYDPDEQIRSADSGAVEDVVLKSELRADTISSARFKQRFLRHIGRHQESLSSTQARYRELLAKSLREALTDDERSELTELEENRLLPSQAEDERYLSKLDQQVRAAERLLEQLRNLRSNE